MTDTDDIYDALASLSDDALSDELQNGILLKLTPIELLEIFTSICQYDMLPPADIRERCKAVMEDCYFGLADSWKAEQAEVERERDRDFIRELRVGL